MRFVVIWLALAVAAAELLDEPWVEEEDVEEPYDDEQEVVYRRKRTVHYEDPYEERIREKWCCGEPKQVRQEADYVRVPRQVHQYEVHEFTDDESEPSSAPYEEMLASASDHYHKVYASPGAKSARYLNPDVSSTVNVVSQHPANHAVHHTVPYQIQQTPINLAYKGVPSNSAYKAAPNTDYKAVPNVAYPAAPNAAYSGVHNAPYPAAPKAAYKTAPNAAYQVAEESYQPAQPAPFSKPPIHSVPPTHFTHSLPLSASPVLSGPAEVPAPVAEAPVVTLQKLDGDQTVAAAFLHKKHGHAQGGGHKHHAGHHSQHGGKSTKGSKNEHWVDKGAKGHKTDEHHRKEFEEAAGKKKKHHDQAGHKGSHEEEAHGHRGAHFDEKKGHKKGHKTKGYHNKYHKDEFHKEHKFYDDYHKSGEHHRYGKFNAKHASNESGKKKAHHVNAGHDFVERGKKGYSNKGHVDADHKGYDGKKGHEEHHQHQSSHGKKGGKEGGSHWEHAKKN